MNRGRAILSTLTLAAVMAAALAGTLLRGTDDGVGSPGTELEFAL